MCITSFFFFFTYTAVKSKSEVKKRFTHRILIDGQTPVSCKDIKVMQHGIKRRRHGPKRSHRNIPPIGYGDGPAELDAAKDRCRRWLEPIEEPLERRLHLCRDGFVERGKVSGFEALGRDHVGDGGEANGVRLGLGADEAKPLLGDHEGYENLVGSLRCKDLAQVHHRVDVASPRKRHRHHVAHAVASAAAGVMHSRRSE